MEMDIKRQLSLLERCLRMKSKLAAQLMKQGVTQIAETEHMFEKYYELLLSWNEKINLTAITAYDEVVEKHFVDSLTIVKAINMEKCTTLIDIGTGAGFPGIPLKIVFPHLQIVLIDSLEKRISFLDEVINTLQLQDIVAIHGRAENLGKEERYREQFDLCVSRAVSNLSTLSEYCLPFVRIGGRFVSYKGKQVEEEVDKAKKAWEILGGELENVISFKLPESKEDRALVIINKVNTTPPKYPRKAGIPEKRPLK